MNRQTYIRPEFVEFIPKNREEGVVYVSMKYATAVHNCLCGCGLKVVTPISPVGWRLIYDGETISLSPSIGSWEFPCRSHYFIRHNNVLWAGTMSKERIERGRTRDRNARSKHFERPDAQKR
jgi:hypothetical protein